MLGLLLPSSWALAFMLLPTCGEQRASEVVGRILSETLAPRTELAIEVVIYDERTFDRVALRQVRTDGNGRFCYSLKGIELGDVLVVVKAIRDPVFRDDWDPHRIELGFRRVGCTDSGGDCDLGDLVLAPVGSDHLRAMEDRRLEERFVVSRRAGKRYLSEDVLLEMIRRGKTWLEFISRQLESKWSGMGPIGWRALPLVTARERILSRRDPLKIVIDPSSTLSGASIQDINLACSMMNTFGTSIEVMHGGWNYRVTVTDLAGNPLVERRFERALLWRSSYHMAVLEPGESIEFDLGVPGERVRTGCTEFLVSVCYSPGMTAPLPDDLGWIYFESNPVRVLLEK